MPNRVGCRLVALCEDYTILNGRVSLGFGKNCSLVKTNMVFDVVRMFDNGRVGSAIMVSVSNVFFMFSFDDLVSFANVHDIT